MTRSRIAAVCARVEKACWDEETRKNLAELAKDEVLAALNHLLGKKCAHMIDEEHPYRIEYREVL